ncbi:hypothetical protein GCM10009007_13520 [Formosimonas limnophila]|uniref:PAS domain-containing protein n=2 Tax=Formosimonas limnophila TaxID=1384487 RepID=A0A8J3FZF7_9BURK|nr:hypothetical protein GCM10009007_13520 [Formosimonas limnophila]
MQRMYQFTYDSLDHMSTVLLVVMSDGEIMLVNRDTQRLFDSDASDLATLLQGVGANWAKPESTTSPRLNLQQGIELQRDDGQIFVLHVTTVSFETMGLNAQDYANKQNDTVWVIHFLDFSDERLAQSQRTDLIELLSHDLRSPRWLFCLCSHYKNATPRLSEDELHAKIAACVQHTLD